MEKPLRLHVVLHAMQLQRWLQGRGIREAMLISGAVVLFYLHSCVDICLSRILSQLIFIRRSLEGSSKYHSMSQNQWKTWLSKSFKLTLIKDSKLQTSESTLGTWVKCLLKLQAASSSGFLRFLSICLFLIEWQSLTLNKIMYSSPSMQTSTTTQQQAITCFWRKQTKKEKWKKANMNSLTRKGFRRFSNKDWHWLQMNCRMLLNRWKQKAWTKIKAREGELSIMRL